MRNNVAQHSRSDGHERELQGPNVAPTAPPQRKLPSLPQCRALRRHTLSWEKMVLSSCTSSGVSWMAAASRFSFKYLLRRVPAHTRGRHHPHGATLCSLPCNSYARYTPPLIHTRRCFLHRLRSTSAQSPSLGTWDGHHIRALRQHPGQGQLGGGGALALRHSPHALHQLHVLAQLWHSCGALVAQLWCSC